MDRNLTLRPATARKYLINDLAAVAPVAVKGLTSFRASSSTSSLTILPKMDSTATLSGDFMKESNRAGMGELQIGTSAFTTEGEGMQGTEEGKEK